MKDIDYLKKYYKGNIDDAIRLLKTGKPVQYIVGNVDFCGNIIEVDPSVLIPRFETEELVMKTVEYIKKYLDEDVNIVDLGTGSGCIAITLKKILSSAKVSAVDISDEALSVAKKNAYNLDITFYLGNMLEPLSDKFDVIISNPPYISYDEDIMDIVKNNEPHQALYAKNDGLFYYEEILKNCHNYLNEKSIIAFEIGETQKLKICEFIKKYLPDARYESLKDMQGKDRFIFIMNGVN